MSDLITKTIKVSGINSEDGKITLSDGENKYSFFKTKSGSEEETKAYSQYKSLRVEEGQEYPIAFKENQKEYNGKTVTFRNIMFFATKEAGEGNVPVRQENPVQVKNEAIQDPTAFDMGTLKDLQIKVDALNEVIANFRIWAEKVEKRLEAQETLTEPLTTEDAKRLHTELAGTSKTIEQAAAILDGTVEKPFEFPTKTYGNKEGSI